MGYSNEVHSKADIVKQKNWETSVMQLRKHLFLLTHLKKV